MTWALGHLGWTRAYLIAASLGARRSRSRVLVVLHDAPDAAQPARAGRCRWPPVRSSLAASWAHPGTRLGFWMHFTTQFSATALSLLWGYPFFVQGEGQSSGDRRHAAHPDGRRGDGGRPDPRLAGRRAPVAPLDDGAHASSRPIVVVWTVVLAWPGHAPTWLLVVLVVVVGIGGPASMIGFDVGRTSNPARAVRQRQRHHQPGRVPRQPGAGDRDRPRPRLAYAGRRRPTTRRRRSAGR